MLGKRKREYAAVPRRSLHEVEAEQDSNTVNATDLLKKYFEAQFEPLQQQDLRPQASSTDEDEDEDGHDTQSETSDWSGFTENHSGVEEVRVIEHAAVSEGPADSGASEGKYFMSSKPPPVGKTRKPTKAAARAPEAEEDAADAANLKKDLALQRLLKESHLLDRPSLTTAPTIANRDKVTDLRMQSLGAKASLFTQQKMPLAHRKGIQAKAATREDVRRKEALENGVILERASKGKGKAVGKQSSDPPRKRDRGVGTPVVGRFTGGTLKLSRKDIHEINGPKSAVRGKRKGRR